MRKFIYLFAGAALWLASCSQDEAGAGAAPTGNGPAICFRGTFATRSAQETTTASLSECYVTAVTSRGDTYFSRVEFRKEGAYLVSDVDYYWPDDGSTLTFYASNVEEYTPADAASASISFDSDALANRFTFDPVAAVAEGMQSDAATGVELCFHHLFAQVEVRVKSANALYNYTTDGFSLGVLGLSNARTFDYATMSWSGTSQNVRQDVLFSEACTPAVNMTSAASSLGSILLLPRTSGSAWAPTSGDSGTYVGVSLNIETADSGLRIFPRDGKTYGYAVMALDAIGKFEAGKKYVLTLDFSNGAGYVDPKKPEPDAGSGDPYCACDPILGGEITFSATVEEWDSGSGLDYNL